MDEIEQKKSEKIEEKPLVKKNNMKRLLIGIVGVIVLLLFVFKLASPDFQWRYVFFIGGPVVGLGVAAYFWLERGKKDTEEKKEDTPSEATEEQVLLKLDEIIDKRFNHIKEKMDSFPTNKGQNTIYAYRIKLLYPEKFMIDSIESNLKVVWILINANYLKVRGPAFLSGNLSRQQVETYCNNLSSHPETSEIEERTDRDLKEGKETYYKKITPPKKKEAEKPKEEIQ